MSKYMNWELYDKPPEGFSIDKHTGSPLTGYDFYTNGKSVLNGGVRILVKSLNVHVNNIADNHHPVKKFILNSKEPKHDPMINRDVRQRVNVFARERFKVKLLQEIEFDLMVCQLEGWSMGSYVNELKQLIDDVYRRMAKTKKRNIETTSNPKLEFKDE
ncbi:hypothetical protein DW668_04870 [Bacteroides stercoris]|uniref:Uncharacterized protein n=1 Tax=Bacteroides stercoris TaxID=46506 RepID=A0A414Q804_BACSE|nr:hypothetical protein [Bacteroides stercoris]RHF76923.1 hypothetical protein DW668_04870 [Bacteroides stercoris]